MPTAAIELLDRNVAPQANGSNNGWTPDAGR
jgi:hypothetical protein